MIKHHPQLDLLHAYVEGDLPASLSAAITIHADMCPVCQGHLAKLTAEKANSSFSDDGFNFIEESTDDDHDNNGLDMSFDDMIADITACEKQAVMVPSEPKVINVKGQEYLLPRAIENITVGKFSSLGKITRARLDTAEGNIHTSLLQIDAGGEIPEHTHKGYELTLLLDGEFKDEMGSYQAGDFIMLNAEHQHSPVTEHGCLCLTVVSDALHFTKGINKLLNPIGTLIY